MKEQARGLKLIGLYRRGVGGERDNAARLLHAHLRQHDLTLFDLDPSLPVTQDLRALDTYREGAALLSHLDADPSGETLTRLVDAEDLTGPEVKRVLDRLDLRRLTETRLDGWAHTLGLEASELRQAALTLTPGAVLAEQGSVAQRVVQVLRRAHWSLKHPERLIRADDSLTQHLILGLVRGLTGQTGRADDQGVWAHLDPDSLTRLRTLMAGHLPQIRAQALEQAQALAQAFVTGP